MKRTLYITFALILLISLSACNVQDADKDQDNNQINYLEGSLESILANVYENVDVSDQFKEYISTGLQTTEINNENSSYYFGKDIEFESAIASEPIISPSAYSLCLVRAKEGADIEKIKTEIKENVDPMMWVCVGVDEDNIFVDNIGDVIVLIMSDDAGLELHEAFLALKDSTGTES